TIVVIGIIGIMVKYGTSLSQMDPRALELYAKMGDTVLTTGNPAKGMIIKRKLVIEEGSTKEEAIENALEVMDEVGEEYGLMKVDEKTMPRGGKFMKDGGLYTHIRAYCSPSIADKFLSFSGEYIGFMPCRVGIVENDKGEIWIYTMALDMMISGGHTLPAELLDYAKSVSEAMVAMIEKGAAGES
ncbi:MAG: DUF302 domain-containing protein, partial [Epsilonproteobacteria bacterium]|nr:DUF302 domain-containing protein [Campylobacterota bacterium]